MAAYNYTPKEKNVTNIEELNDKTQHILDQSQRLSAQNAAKNKTVKTLNAIKIISPILEALTIYPGEQGQELDSFKQLITATSGLSVSICKKLEIDPEDEKNYWIRNSFERVFSEILKEQWIHNKTLDTTKIESMFDTIIENNDFVQSEFQSLGITIDQDVQMCLAKSAIVLIEQMKSGFNLNRKIEKDLEPIMNLIFNTAKDAFNQIVDANAEPKQKANLLKMLIQEATNLYKTSWKAYAIFAKDFLDNSSTEKKATLTKKYANGFPLTQIDKEFKENFDKLILITQKIVPNQKGNIEKRIV